MRETLLQHICLRVAQSSFSELANRLEQVEKGNYGITMFFPENSNSLEDLTRGVSK